jgi:hypothetical protein
MSQPSSGLSNTAVIHTDFCTNTEAGAHEKRTKDTADNFHQW